MMLYRGLALTLVVLSVGRQDGLSLELEALSEVFSEKGHEPGAATDSSIVETKRDDETNGYLRMQDVGVKHFESDGGSTFPASVDKAEVKLNEVSLPNLTIEDEDWGYIDVREGAHLFYVMYGCRNKEMRAKAPLVIWLQGGPGASSVGFGNFAEIGPRSIELNPETGEIEEKARVHTWAKDANLLFIDSPVGTGFSYADSEDLYARDNDQIATDLLSFFKQFLNKHPAFQETSLFIFSESYGGKMTVGFAQTLLRAITLGEIRINFEGIALGDSWISPIDYVKSWGPYLEALGWIDDRTDMELAKASSKCEMALHNGNGTLATKIWEEIEQQIIAAVDFDPFYYSIHRKKDPILDEKKLTQYINTVIRAHFNSDEGKPKIPDSVTFSVSSAKVFGKLREDFMRPVVRGRASVDSLLRDGRIKVTVYEGQLDLICNTLGTEAWIDRLEWPGLPYFRNSIRTPLYASGAKNLKDSSIMPDGFVKRFQNFEFYWIMMAGHMVPADAPEMALKMFRQIIQHASPKNTGF